jgi:hypothetical protein
VVDVGVTNPVVVSTLITAWSFLLTVPTVEVALTVAWPEELVILTETSLVL